ncbi:MAG: FmdB family zinc ribbon protein [Pseudomonadota bacterium]
MPIYAYKCESCGFAKDVLQKMSDAPLSVCPNCGAPAFKKQVTAAGFQLKGSGWYVTDFRGGSATGAPAPSGQGEAASPASAKTVDTAASGAPSQAQVSAPASAPAPAPAASPAPASSKPSGKDSS